MDKKIAQVIRTLVQCYKNCHEDKLLDVIEDLTRIDVVVKKKTAIIKVQNKVVSNFFKRAFDSNRRFGYNTF